MAGIILDEKYIIDILTHIIDNVFWMGEGYTHTLTFPQLSNMVGCVWSIKNKDIPESETYYTFRENLKVAVVTNRGVNVYNLHEPDSIEDMIKWLNYEK